jgi:hypothetical protein
VCAEASAVLRAVAADFFLNCWRLEIPSDNRIRHVPGASTEWSASRPGRFVPGEPLLLIGQESGLKNKFLSATVQKGCDDRTRAECVRADSRRCHSRSTEARCVGS